MIFSIQILQSGMQSIFFLSQSLALHVPSWCWWGGGGGIIRWTSGMYTIIWVSVFCKSKDHHQFKTKPWPKIPIWRKKHTALWVAHMNTGWVVTQIPQGIRLPHHNLRRLSQLVDKTGNQRHSGLFMWQKSTIITSTFVNNYYYWHK